MYTACSCVFLCSERPLFESFAAMSLEETARLLPCTQQTANTQPPGSDETLGYLGMFLSAICDSVSTFSLRVAQGYLNVSPATSLFARGFIQMTLGLIGILLFADFRRPVLSRVYLLLLPQVMASAIAVYFFQTSTSLIPAGDAISIFSVTPVITFLFAHVALKESFSKFHVCASVLAIFGCYFIACPDPTHSSLESNISYNQRMSGSLYVGVATLCVAISCTFLRSIGTKIHFLTPVLLVGVCTTLLAIALGGEFNPFNALPAMSRGGVIAVCLSGVSSFLAQCFFGKGVQHCRVGPGLLIRNIDVPIVYGAGILILNEIPSAMQVVGAMLILTSSAIVTLLSKD